MTFPHSWRWLNICVSILAFSGCSRHEVVESAPNPAAEAVPSAGAQSRYDWAVQYYESGKYNDAIASLQKLKNEGAENPSFLLVPYYLGMAHFKLRDFPQAKALLQDFLRSQAPTSENQEARLALLLIYEAGAEWEALLGLAAETDRLTLFQNNRALLKLLWARALVAKGEDKGARLTLESAQQYMSGDPNASARNPDPARDLWGRFHFTSLLLEMHGCEGLRPRETRSQKTVRRAYPGWFEASTDCLRKGLDLSVKEILLRESTWSEPASKEIQKGVASFEKKTNGYFKLEKANLVRRRAFEATAKSNLYRLLAAFDQASNRLKAEGLGVLNLDEIRKELDLLLLSISRSS